MTSATVTPLQSATEHAVRMADGTRIFYRAWLPAAPTRRAVVMFHRGHEHSGRLADVIAELDLQDTAVFAWDARGHGRSDGERGYAPGFAEMVRDVDTFMRHVCAHHGFAMNELVVVAHSVGAVTLATWVHDYAPPIRGLVLVTPAFAVKLYVPLAIPGLRLLQRCRPGRHSFVKSYVKARMLTHDPDQARRYDADPLITRAIAVNVLLEMRDTARRVVADAGAIDTPTLVLTGERDWVVEKGVQRRFFARLGSETKTMRSFPGMYHDLLHEKERSLVLDEIRAFLGRVFYATPPRRALLHADRDGFTRQEHDRLTRPLTPLTPRWLGYRLQSLLMRTLGRLSRGIRLGYRTGFDSGQSLDYVYENRPRGALLLGRWIDRAYLGSQGWRGIRQRRVNLQAMLARAITAVGDAGHPVRILDLAAGAGRYVLDALAAAPGIDIAAVLRDNTQANLETGRDLAKRMGIGNARYEVGDAFDAASIAGIDPAPNVGVVSGLYELFPDNERVSRSLRGLATALRAGAARAGGEAWFVYTGQ
ncbi:MAG: bifunctional alpha/beta hydrolase/class I SAM-dependent methyltransferase, partial [Planctomycetes bacterium]|nr:bifunctional alpha/beta hydrolase/class I SAM-dependent methyltransferase [Planctomycetota bacterium]